MLPKLSLSSPPPPGLENSDNILTAEAFHFLGDAHLGERAEMLRAGPVCFYLSDRDCLMRIFAARAIISFIAGFSLLA